MNEYTEDVMRQSIYLIERKEGFNGNERQLLKLDFDVISNRIEELEDRVEELELAKDDYSIIDKDNINDIVKRALKYSTINDVIGMFEEEIKKIQK